MSKQKDAACSMQACWKGPISDVRSEWLKIGDAADAESLKGFYERVTAALEGLLPKQRSAHELFDVFAFWMTCKHQQQLIDGSRPNKVEHALATGALGTARSIAGMILEREADKYCVPPSLFCRSTELPGDEALCQDFGGRLGAACDAERHAQKADVSAGAERKQPSDGGALAPEHRCAPMSKSEIARRYLNRGKAKPIQAEAFMTQQDIQQEPGVRLFTIRLDDLSPELQARFKRPLC